MLRNSSLGGLLEKLYAQEGVFSDLSNDRFRQLVRASVPNERINIDNGNRDGPDLTAYYIHQNIYRLLGTVPVEGEWLEALYYLLSQIGPFDQSLRLVLGSGSSSPSKQEEKAKSSSGMVEEKRKEEKKRMRDEG
jgi:hypothetical protein